MLPEQTCPVGAAVSDSVSASVPLLECGGEDEASDAVEPRVLPRPRPPRRRLRLRRPPLLALLPSSSLVPTAATVVSIGLVILVMYVSGRSRSHSSC